MQIDSFGFALSDTATMLAARRIDGLDSCQRIASADGMRSYTVSKMTIWRQRKSGATNRRRIAGRLAGDTRLWPNRAFA
jgi:hypothetical protein